MIIWKTKINYITYDESLILIPLFSLLPPHSPLSHSCLHQTPSPGHPTTYVDIGEAAVGIRGEQCELEALPYFLHSQF